MIKMSFVKDMMEDVVKDLLKKYFKGVDLKLNTTIETEKFGNFKVSGKIKIILLRKENE